MIKNIIASAVTAIVVVVIALVLVGGNQSVQLGGTTNYDSLGLSGTLSVTGAITSRAGISGTTGTFTDFGKFGSTASSTVQIGAASKSGCLIVGDSANGASPVYITATGATITASTTKPAACQTAQ